MTDESVYTGLYVISEGPIEGPVTAELAKSIYCNDVPVMDSSGSMNFEGIALAYRSGLPSQTAITGIPAAVSPVSVGLDVTHAQPVEVTVSGQYDAVNVTIAFPQGLYRISDGGNQKGEDADYQIEVKSNGSGLWVPVSKTLLKYQKIISAFEKSYRIDLPAGGSPWLVRVVRNSADTGNPNIINDFTFARYETVVDGKFQYPNIAQLALQIGAKQFNNQIPKVSGKFYGLKMWVPKNYDPVARTYATSGAGTSGGIWDGTFKLAYTNNPCWVYFDIVCNNRYGLGLEINPNNDIVSALADKWNLYVISQYCDGMVDNGYGGTEPRFTFNAYLNSKAGAYDFLQMIVSSFRGMIYYASNQLYVAADIPDTIDAIFTQTDVEDGNFTYNGTPLKTRSSVVYVKWQNPANLYKTEVEIVEDREALTQFGFREKTIEGVGVTSRGLARRLAKWMLLTEKMQTQTITFTTGFQGAKLFPGNLIKIMNPYRAGVRYGGKLVSATTTSFVLDSTVTLVSGQTYSLTTVAPDGTLNTKVVTTGIGTTNTLTTSALSTAPMEHSTWVLTSTALDGEQYRVVQVKDKKGKYEVVAVQHYPGKYAEIEDGPQFPVIDTSLYDSNQLPAPTSVSVNQWYDNQSGAEGVSRVTVSWPQVLDNRVARYELQMLTSTSPWSTVLYDNLNTWDSTRVPVSTAAEVRFRVRALSSLGNFSDWIYTSYITIEGKTQTPAAPFNISASGIINGININWDNQVISDFKFVEVWTNTINNSGTATLLAEISDDFYTQDNLTPGTIYYYWLKTVTHAATSNTSSFSGVVYAVPKQVQAIDIATGVIDATKFASGIEPVSLVSGSLPTIAGYTGPKVVFFNNELYNYTPTGWLSTTDVIAGSIDATSFASSIKPIEIVSTLPTTGNVAGRSVFLTTDGKLYRYYSGAFTAVVPAADITGTLTNSQIADLAAAKITGQITTTQITNNAITTPLINAGAITTAKIAALAVTASEIAANTITAGQIAANTVTANEIAANAITASELAADSVVAGKVAAAAINTRELIAGAVTAEKLTVASFDNLIRNGDMSSGDLSSFSRQVIPSGSTISMANSSTGWPSPYALFAQRGANTGELSIVLNNTSFDDTTMSGGIPSNIDDEFYIEAIVYQTHTSNITFDAVIRTNSTTIAQLPATAISNTTGGSSLAASAGTTSFTKYTGYFKNTTGNGKVYIRAGWNSTINGSNGYIWNVIVRRRNSSQLIVDGAITANALAANSVVAGKIAAGAISATEIATGAITISKMGANSVDTVSIVNGAITAGKISVTNIAAINADLGTITAGLIKNAANTVQKDITNGLDYIYSGSYVKVSGAAFGASSNLMEWWGPSTTPVASMTKANSLWCLATDGNVYYGGSVLNQPSASGSKSTGTSASITGSSWQTAMSLVFTSRPASGYWNITFMLSAAQLASGTFGNSNVEWRVVEVESSTTLGSGTCTFDASAGAGGGQTVPIGFNNSSLYGLKPQVAGAGTVTLILEFRLTSATGNAWDLIDMSLSATYTPPV